MEKARILIVDTDSLTSSMLKAAYEKKGASVDVITDPNKVVEQFKTGRYNMVVLDSLPPLHKGFDYCQKIRAIKGGEKIPLLMTSISSDDSYARKAITAGATAYEAKPFSVTAFANRSLELMNQQLEAGAPPPPRSEPVAAPPPSKPPAPPPAAPPPTAPSQPATAAKATPLPSAGAASAGPLITVDRGKVLDIKRQLGAKGPNDPVMAGSLFDVEFPWVLAKIFLLCQHGVLPEFGVLRAQREKVKKEIFFRRGLPVHVRSNLVSETLGRLLVEQGKINRKQLEESLLEMKRTGQLQGDVLVDLGFLNRPELDDALLYQERIKLSDVFGWEDGDFDFIVSSRPILTVAEYQIPYGLMMSEGIARTYPITRLRRKFERYQDQRLVFNPDPILEWRNTPLEADQQDYINRLFAGPAVKEAMKIPGIDEERALPLLYALLCSKRFLLADQPGAFDFESELLDGCLIYGSAPPGSTQQSAPPVQPVPPAPEPESAPPAVEARPAAQPATTPPAGAKAPARSREELLAEIEKMEKMNYYQILNVDKKAGLDALKINYFKLAKEFHPDKFYKYDPDLQKRADHIFAVIGEAYSTLSDSERRKEYDIFLETGKTRAEVNEEVTRILQAEERFKIGEIHLKKREYLEALKSFQWAMERNPDEPEFEAYYGWAIYKQDETGGLAEGKQLIQRSIARGPKNDQPHYFLAQIHQKENNMAEAINSLKACLALNKYHPQAGAELRMLERRVAASKEKKGK